MVPMLPTLHVCQPLTDLYPQISTNPTFIVAGVILSLIETLSFQELGLCMKIYGVE